MGDRINPLTGINEAPKLTPVEDKRPSGGGSSATNSTVLSITDGITDEQLRATAVPVSVASLPLPSDAATSAQQLADNHQVAVSNFPSSQKVEQDIMIDVDVTIGYSGDKPTSIVMTKGSQTKTMVIGWTGENMTSIATTIT